MKDLILKSTLYIMRIALNVIYFFIKLFPMQKNKVLMLSRQSNEISVDFELLQNEIEKNKDIKVKILCKKIPKDFLGKVKYCFYMIKCMYHISTSRVCIVDGYVIPVSALKHKKRLIIVQIWHAMGAIKKFGRQVLDKREGTKKSIADIMRMHKNYTFVTCTSEKTKEFYSEAFGIEKQKILVLGMPRIDYLLNEEVSKTEEIFKDYPILKEKKNILYVPTFRKNKKIQLDDIINAIDEEKYNLIIKLHPLDETEVDKKYVVNKKYKTIDLLKIADYVITDYSAVAFETVTLNKPLFFYLYDEKEYEEDRGLNINLKEEMASSTFSDIKDIVKVIEDDNYNYVELENFKNKYVETSDNKNTERIVNYIMKLMEE